MYAQILALAALFATSAVAQSSLPSCAQSCITNYGDCNAVDVKCICSNQPLLETLSCCVSQKCTADEITQVVAFADNLCGQYGVTTLPQAASCAATGSASAASATGSSTPSGSSSPATASATSTGAIGALSSASSSASAATTTSGSAAGKNYRAEGMGLGMALMGLLAAL